jgi:hypothetical protein
MGKGLHKPNQNRRILDYIALHGGITTLEAEHHLGVQRLASRISDLKKRGYHVVDEWVKVKNRWGEPCRVKRYSIAKENQDEAQEHESIVDTPCMGNIPGMGVSV